MSNFVYPKLPGLKMVLRRKPAWSTAVRATPSGREYRAGNWQRPRGGLTVGYEFLRSDVETPELQQLVGFFHTHRGSLFSFLFDDLEDNAVVDQPLGLGDGTTTGFQLLRTWGGYAQAVYEPRGTPAVKLDGGHLNMLASGAAFDGVAWDGPAAVTANTHLSPGGATDADTVSDSSTSVLSYLHQAAAIADDDQPVTASIYVRQTSGGTSPTFRLLLRLSGGTQVDAEARINTDTGAVLAGDVVVQSVSGYWRISVTAVNNLSGNTQADVWLYPAWSAHGAAPSSVTAMGSAVFYGCKLERSASVGPFTSRTYTLGDMGLLTVTPAPGVGQALSWTGGYYWRMRFARDELDLERFLHQLYQSSSVELLYAPEG